MSSTSMWTEKYRPEKLEDVVGQEGVVEDVKGMIEEENVPHMLLAGRHGLGKTTLAHVIANELYGEDKDLNFKELNASDDRGIDVVREDIKQFARQSPYDADFKIILLDEADNLTRDAQPALRRIMEKYEETCRFILTCNHPEQIIDAIAKSRCTLYRFKDVDSDKIQERISEVLEKEDVDITDEALGELSDKTVDVRDALNRSQVLSSKTDLIEISDVKSSNYDDALLNAIKAVVSDKDFAKAREAYGKYKSEGGQPRQFVKHMHEYIMGKKGLSDELKGVFSEELRQADRDLIEGVNDDIEIYSLIYKLIDRLA